MKSAAAREFLKFKDRDPEGCAKSMGMKPDSLFTLEEAFALHSIFSSGIGGRYECIVHFESEAHRKEAAELYAAFMSRLLKGSGSY